MHLRSEVAHQSSKLSDVVVWISENGTPSVLEISMLECRLLADVQMVSSISLQILQLVSKLARVLKATLPPTKARKLVILTPLRSVPHHNLCSDVTRPPTRKMRPFFLIGLLS